MITLTELQKLTTLMNNLEENQVCTVGLEDYDTEAIDLSLTWPDKSVEHIQVYRAEGIPEYINI